MFNVLAEAGPLVIPILVTAAVALVMTLVGIFTLLLFPPPGSPAPRYRREGQR